MIPLTTLEEFQAALQQSHETPVFIFKHSQTCGTSAFAFEEMETWLSGLTENAARTFVVDVHRDRAVARGIAEHLHVRHESPQLLLIRRGMVVWHASHYRITAEQVQRALDNVPT